MSSMCVIETILICTKFHLPHCVAPRVYSFPVFSKSFCFQFIEELKHYEESDVPKGRPNTMNNTGVRKHSYSTYIYYIYICIYIHSCVPPCIHSM